MGDQPDDEKGAGEDKGAGKGKLIAVIAIAVVVIAGGGAAAYFTGLLDPLLGRKAGSKVATIDLGTPVTHQLPQIKADLKTGKCSAPLIRTTIVIQLASTDLPRLQTAELRVVDSIRAHLRDQEREQMVGKAGTDKLRVDLTNIINNVIMPARIQSILFKEFVLQ
ncbi:MAG: flagellar basal body-associated FliL family protein [Rhodospirillales bacterium]|nr:flagellar basal body-associated FliL family protein [Rhodospirillales bacterium]